MDRNFIAGVVIVSVVASVAAAMLKGPGRNPLPPPITAETPQRAAFARSHGPTSALVPEQPRGPAPDASEAPVLVAQVEHKYRYLIGEIDRAYIDELKRRLLARETELSLPARERMDSNIGELLPAKDFAYYQALKDSDLEQHHLTEYTGGISNAAPLDERQERLVLEAKLHQKPRYAAVMRDAGLERDTMSAEERKHAHARAAEALQQSLNEFLMEVSPVLSADQYQMLKNYETTELARELSRLQQRINAK